MSIAAVKRGRLDQLSPVSKSPCSLLVVLLLLLLATISNHPFGSTAAFASAFAMSSSSPSFVDKRIFGVPNSGWRSPQWNWGYGVGTGHDCAIICRRQFGTATARRRYVDALRNGDVTLTNVEEIKLTLALTWQRGRRDGSDGGPNGYRQVLAQLAAAERYEDRQQEEGGSGRVNDDGAGDECAGTRRLVEDMQQRFCLVAPASAAALQDEMKSLLQTFSTGVAFRKCSGLVLKEVGFIENGC
jgi:hypothetical protein